MDDLLTTWWRELAERPAGPLAFRFYLQPVMALLLAARDGVRDARAGRPAYFWSLFTDPAHRGEALRSGWTSIVRVVLLALVLDLAYQVLVLRGLRPLQLLFVAIGLAILPYVLLRGPAGRLARLAHRPGHPPHPAA